MADSLMAVIGLTLDRAGPFSTVAAGGGSPATIRWGVQARDGAQRWVSSIIGRSRPFSTAQRVAIS
ncbi:hypothetical protein GCM10009016_02470 [Halomonas beimenensis]